MYAGAGAGARESGASAVSAFLDWDEVDRAFITPAEQKRNRNLSCGAGGGSGDPWNKRASVWAPQQPTSPVAVLARALALSLSLSRSPGPLTFNSRMNVFLASTRTQSPREQLSSIEYKAKSTD